jgi:gliding motility-associated-like protein
MGVYGGIPYTMVPQIVQKNPFFGLLQRCGRVTLWGLLLLLLAVTGRSQTALPGTPYFYTLTTVTNNSIADGSTNDVLQVVVYTQSATLPYTYTPVNNVQVNFLDSGATTSTTINTGEGEYNSIPFAVGTIVFGQASITTTPADVEITIDGVQVQSEIFTYIPGPVNANPPPGSKNPSDYITIIPSATANGSDTTVVQVHATDGTNNELPGTPVQFTIVGGSGSAETSASFNGTPVALNVPYSVPGGLGQNGSLDLPITSPSPGSVQVEVQVWNGSGWVEIGSPRTVTFVVPPPTNTPPTGSTNPSYYITVIPTATANNSDTAVVRLHITDGTNNEPDGYQVEFIITSNTTGANATMTGTAGNTSTGTLTTVLGTNANGSIDVPITDPQAGSVMIAAYAWDPVTSAYDIPFGTVTVNFVAAPPTNTPPTGSTNPSYYITVIPTADANNSDTAVVRLHITDGTNNEPDGYKVEFIITSNTTGANATMTGTLGNTSTGTLTTVLGTNANGSIDVPITDPQVGSVMIAAYAWDPVTSAYDIPFGTVTVNFVAAPPTNTPPTGSANPSYYISVIPSVTANGSDTDVVRLHITDGTNNEPDGYKVEFVVTNNPATAASAAAIMTGTLGNTSTGTLTTVLGTNANGSIDIPITDLKAGSVTIQAYAWDPATNAYDISFGTVTVTFTAGSAVPGDPGGGGAGGTSPGGGGIPPGGGGSGTGGTGPGGDNTGPGSNSGYTVLFVRQDNQLANGSQQDSVIAYITDANGNAVIGTAVTFSIEITPNSGTITSGAQFVGSTTTVSTDDSGMARIAMTSTTPGTVFVVATIVDPTSGTTVLIDGSYQIVTFVDKPDTSNPQTALTVIVYEAIADGVSRTAVQAHVVGINGEVMADQPVTFTIDSGSAQIVTAQPVYTDANGNAIIYLTSTTPGYALVTATVDGLPIDYGSPARVYFAPINIYVPRVFTPNGDGVNDVLKPILVGITSFQYFTVYNRWGNIIFQTTDPNQGWDGTFKGVPQPVETYLWIAAGVDENGKTIVQKGMTSLVR